MTDPKPKLTAPDIDFYIGEDGVPVIHIDTPDNWGDNEDGPICRVYMNDDTDNPLFANPEFPADLDNDNFSKENDK